MTKVALRGLRQRKLRAFVTMLAVLLGVAFIAGSYVLTDTINRSFDDIFDVAYEGTDVAVSSSTTGQTDSGGGAGVPGALPGRGAAGGRGGEGGGGIFSLVRFVDEKGEPLSTAFAPEFVSSDCAGAFETLDLHRGRPPQTGSEASIDQSTAEREGLEPGDTLRIAGPAGVKAYELTGIQRLGDTVVGRVRHRAAHAARGPAPDREAGRARRHLDPGRRGRLARGELSRRVGRVLPARLTVETGTQAAARQAQDIKDDLSFFRVILLVFGGVALLVGSFLIFNTFSITVAQRIRELGLLRTLGASRGQVLRGMILEATIIGLLGSVLGVLAGIGFAGGAERHLQELRHRPAQHRHASSPPARSSSRSAVGLLVTLFSALIPAAARHPRVADGGAARGRAAREPHARAALHRLRRAADARPASP